MPNGTENEIRLPSLDDLFSSQKERNEAKLKRIEEIPLSEIDPFPDHPFKVKDDEDMDNLVESIRAQGIITPAAVRKKKDGRYELVSGHRRKRACEILGMTTLRCEVLDLSKDEATIFMVESNFQRTTILPSEKAFAYKMRLEAIKSQIGRMKDNQKRGMNYGGAPVEPQLRQAQDHLMRAYGMTEEEVQAVGTADSRKKEHGAPVVHLPDGKKSRDLVAASAGVSYEHIRRYIRLTELIPQLLDLVDEGKIAIRPAVELSYLEHRQIDVYNCIEMEQCTPTHAQAIRMRKLYQEGKLNVTRWGSKVELTGQKLVMKKGDILFGKRNTYLRRAAIAPHDGIFSAHGMIFRPKTEVIDEEYFPFFISSDYFMNAAIRISVGSLSPTVNWKTLKDLEFDIPDLVQQRKSAEILSAANQTKEAYELLLNKTDDLVKSQFIEQFGADSKYPTELLDSNVEEMFIGPFGSSLKNECFVSKEEGFCMVYEQKHAIQKTMDLETRYVTEQKYKELQRFNVTGGDIIVSCRGTIGEVFSIPDDAPLGIMHPSIMKIRLKKEKYDKDFFVFALEQYMKEHINEANGTAVKMAVSAKTLGKERFIIPDLQTQQAFVAFVKQSDKSKFELQKSIEAVHELIKSIQQQDFSN